MTAVFRQIETEDRLAWTCIAWDPDRAVIEHPSAALAQLVLRSTLLALAIRVEQGDQHRDLWWKEVLSHGAKRVRPDALMTQENAGITRATDRKLLVEDPTLEPQRPVGPWPQDRCLFRAFGKLAVRPRVLGITALDELFAVPGHADEDRPVGPPADCHILMDLARARIRESDNQPAARRVGLHRHDLE